MEIGCGISSECVTFAIFLQSLRALVISASWNVASIFQTLGALADRHVKRSGVLAHTEKPP
jgi:hypothetical protein